MQKIFFISLLAFFSLVSFDKGSDWELRKEMNSIKVYTRAIEGSNYHAFKAEGILYAEIPFIIGNLKDSEKISQWAPNCKTAKALKKTDNEQYIYIETEVRFPFQNRDLVYHFKFTYPPGTKDIKILIDGIPDYISPKEGIVRIPRSNGYLFLEYINYEKTKAIYQLHAEPGGNIPPILANLNLVEMAYGTLVGLKKLVE